MLIGQMTVVSAVMFTVLAFIIAFPYVYGAREASEFSMELTGFEGLNATMVGSAVSPMFSLKARINNSRMLQSWCYDSGEVVVSYSGVALAWGHVPRFCAQKGALTEFTVRLWGRAVDLSSDLCRRLVLDVHTGTTQILVEMKLFYDNKGLMYRGPLVRKFQLMLRGANTVN
ncbi:hypothetical protein HU200_050223 [Digitaria exilis]|uniref:Late embryogenesis abundant protein LEA-2 subgroup domain-containing protein n=1 Tax=Digitaria exilis TaxID=1010633 RepID=A0A835EBC0_9POAL|nr:hypothetical protein HU200_050223 [Digitaria exilis]CAB3473405.1 unnamed protein product [Digitaria exilis]